MDDTKPLDPTAQPASPMGDQPVGDQPMGAPAPTQTPANPAAPAVPADPAVEAPVAPMETPAVAPDAPALPTEEKPEEAGGMPPTGAPPAPTM